MPEIRNIEIDDVPEFREALDSVAKERKYLLTLEAPSIERIEKFVSNNLSKGYPQVVAVENKRIVGWADFVPEEKESLRHSAHLGMGVVQEFRGNGIGKALLESVYESAMEYGFERLELEVFSNNERAIKLYEKFGFVLEGIKVNARKIDGEYQNAHIMAKIVT